MDLIIKLLCKILLLQSILMTQTYNDEDFRILSNDPDSLNIIFKNYDKEYISADFKPSIGRTSNISLDPVENKKLSIMIKDKIENQKVPFRWNDFNSENNDFWFDRVVGIMHNDTHIGSGVLINMNHVLTSYNPFRKLMRDGVSRSEVNIVVLRTRIYKTENFTGPVYVADSQRRRVYYTVIYAKVNCGRPVVPIPEGGDVTWHGPEENRENLPTHDLFVMRLSSRLIFVHEKMLSLHWSSYTKDNVSVLAGPSRVKLAQENDMIKNNVFYGSFALMNKKHAKRNRVLMIERPDTNVTVPCDEWIPKDWGYFICISNHNNRTAIGSGALLFAGDHLYGIGSFLMRRGNSSILVFTDIRPYRRLIYRTCVFGD